MKKIEYLTVKNRTKSYRIPFYIIKGAQPGKRLMLIAGQHGVEWIGIEVIRRLFLQINPVQLAGTIYAVPVANPMAVSLGEQHFLFNQKEKQLSKHPAWLVRKHCYNMNRVWPGKKDGTILEQAAYLIWKRGVINCDILIDFHCYSRNNPHSVYVTPDTIDIGRVLNLGFLADHSGNPQMHKALSHIAMRYGIKSLVVEFSGSKEIIEEEVLAGIKATYNLMSYLKMISIPLVKPKKQYLLDTKKTKNILVRAPQNGFVVHHKSLLEKVSKGDIICEIFNLEYGKITGHVKSPINGVITHRRYINLVKKNEVVAAVADMPQV